MYEFKIFCTGVVLGAVLVIAGVFVGLDDWTDDLRAGVSACEQQKATTINLLNGCRAELLRYRKDVEIQHFSPNGDMELQYFSIPTGFLNAYFDLDPSLREVCFPRREWYTSERSFD